MIQLAHAVHRSCPSIYVCGNKVVIVTIIIKYGGVIIPPRDPFPLVTFFREERVYKIPRRCLNQTYRQSLEVERFIK